MDVCSENPFEGLKIDPHEPLHRATARTQCPECGSSRKYFCYRCHIPMEAIAGKFQTVQLPVKVDIIKHPLELDGKSTAIHARILAPDHVTIYTYPHIPQYDNKEKLLLVFPGKDAVTLEQLMEQHRTSPDENSKNRHEQPEIDLASHISNIHLEGSEHVAQLKPKRSTTHSSDCSTAETNHSANNQTLVSPETDTKGLVHSETSVQDRGSHCCHQNSPSTLHKDPSEDAETKERDGAYCGQRGAKIVESKKGPFERVIFVDCTWNRTAVFSRDERLAGIKTVILEDRLTTFWRKQYRKPQTYLATIEAIYYFMVDFHNIVLKDVYSGQYDNLLFFYSFMYHLVQKTLKERVKREKWSVGKNSCMTGKKGETMVGAL